MLSENNENKYCDQSSLNIIKLHPSDWCLNNISYLFQTINRMNLTSFCFFWREGMASDFLLSFSSLNVCLLYFQNYCWMGKGEKKTCMELKLLNCYQ